MRVDWSKGSVIGEDCSLVCHGEKEGDENSFLLLFETNPTPNQKKKKKLKECKMPHRTGGMAEGE